MVEPPGVEDETCSEDEATSEELLSAEEFNSDDELGFDDEFSEEILLSPSQPTSAINNIAAKTIQKTFLKRFIVHLIKIKILNYYRKRLFSIKVLTVFLINSAIVNYKISTAKGLILSNRFRSQETFNSIISINCYMEVMVEN